MRTIKYLLAIILLLSVFSSCGNTKTDDNSNPPTVNNNDNTPDKNTDNNGCIGYDLIYFRTDPPEFQLFLDKLQKCATDPAELEKCFIFELTENGEIVKIYDIGVPDNIYDEEEIVSEYNFFKEAGYFGVKFENEIKKPEGFEFLPQKGISYSYVVDGIVYGFDCRKTTESVDRSGMTLVATTELDGRKLDLFVDPNQDTTIKGTNLKTYWMYGTLYTDNYRLDIAIRSYNCGTVSEPQLSATAEYVKNNFDLSQFVLTPIYPEADE